MQLPIPVEISILHLSCVFDDSEANARRKSAPKRRKIEATKNLEIEEAPKEFENEKWKRVLFILSVTQGNSEAKKSPKMVPVLFKLLSKYEIELRFFFVWFSMGGDLVY